MTHIKLYGIKPRIQYVADGILTTYDFPFVVFTTTDVQVYLNDTLQNPKTYTVSGIKTNGGTIAFTTPPSNGTIITITRDLSIERTTDFQEGGTLRADTLNDELDYQTACLQQIADSINRSMILPPYATDTDVDLTLPTPSAGKAIVWNAEGTNLENSDIKINDISRELDAKVASATTQAEIANSSATMATEQAQNATKQAQIAAIQADIATQKANEASETLTSKADSDLTNLSATARTLVANLGMPDYTAAITYPGNCWIQAPCDCYVIGGLESGNSLNTQLEVNSNATETNYVVLSRVYGYANVQGVFIQKGFYFRLSCTNGVTYNTMYFPLIGVK